MPCVNDVPCGELLGWQSHVSVVSIRLELAYYRSSMEHVCSSYGLVKGCYLSIFRGKYRIDQRNQDHKLVFCSLSSDYMTWRITDQVCI